LRRGDVIAGTALRLLTNSSNALVWMSDEAMKAGRGYWLKLATQTVSATVQSPNI
jgi:bifunctional enzyme CysN/CysC